MKSFKKIIAKSKRKDAAARKARAMAKQNAAGVEVDLTKMMASMTLKGGSNGTILIDGGAMYPKSMN